MCGEDKCRKKREEVAKTRSHKVCTLYVGVNIEIKFGPVAHEKCSPTIYTVVPYQ